MALVKRRINNIFVREGLMHYIQVLRHPALVISLEEIKKTRELIL